MRMRLSLTNNREWLATRIVFFSLFYIYLWMVVKPHLLYYGCGEITNFPVFYKGWAFFNEVVPHPGGPIKYLSDFLLQFLYYSWAGAFVLTTHALLICVFTEYYLKKVGIVRTRFISIIPSILLLITYNGYTYHFTTAFAFLAALIFASIYVTIVCENKVLNVLLFLFLSVVLYFIAAGAYLFFSLLCCIHEIFFRRQVITGFLYGVFAVCVGYIWGVLLFKVSPNDAYSELLPFSWKIDDYTHPGKLIEVVYALYLMVPVIAIVSALWKLITQHRFFLLHIKRTSKADPGKPKRKKKKQLSDTSNEKDQTIASCKSKIKLCFKLCFLFVIAAGASVFSFNPERKAAFEVDYYLNNKEWKKVIDIGRRYQDNDHIIHAMNRALYHFGRLSSDMFCYNQSMRSFMLTAAEEAHSPWNKIGTYYDLGAVNKCECVLIDSLEKYGERPELIKKLAVVRIAKNDIPTARVYLETLKKTLFYSDWASDCLKQLDTDPNMSSDKEIQHLRSLMFSEDEDKGELEFRIESLFIDLLKRNPKNQMAFEYLMAYYLLLDDTKGFVQNIDRINDYNYPQIPRHYEEAILLYKYLTNNSDFKDISININSIYRFNEFTKISERYGKNLRAAYNELRGSYSDTFYFYYKFGVSGLQNE